MNRFDVNVEALSAIVFAVFSKPPDVHEMFIKSLFNLFIYKRKHKSLTFKNLGTIRKMFIIRPCRLFFAGTCCVSPKSD